MPSAMAPRPITARTQQAEARDTIPADQYGAGQCADRLDRAPRPAGSEHGAHSCAAPEGPAAAADVQVSMSINGHDLPLDFCSRSCRTADVTLVGGEHVDVVAD